MEAVERAPAEVAAVVPAAGSGTRLGVQGAKALVRLAGRPLLLHAVADLEASRSVTAIVVVAHPDQVAASAELIAAAGLVKVAAVVPGGPTRQASVALGLAALPPGARYVAVHDAARPLAGGRLLDELLDQLLAGGPNGPGSLQAASVAGVVPGAPVSDTVRRVDADQRSLGIVDREQLRAIQTPQLFDRAVLEEAHRRAARAGVEATDEAALVEWAGHAVRVVPGPVENLKVTTALDLAVAEAIVARRQAAGGGAP
ncbi:MAG TPA: 2-C-methyl-D-erythritol 4-phosphate cytidylyltransferase [Actinomycetes bacterium]